MKHSEKKARVTLRSGTAIDNASAGGPYATKFVKAKVRSGIEVHLEEWAPEHGSKDVYLSLRVRSARNRNAGPGHSEESDAVLSLAHLDALVELLTLARDRARETFFVEKKRKRA